MIRIQNGLYPIHYVRMYPDLAIFYIRIEYHGHNSTFKIIFFCNFIYGKKDTFFAVCFHCQKSSKRLQFWVKIVGHTLKSMFPKEWSRSVLLGLNFARFLTLLRVVDFWKQKGEKVTESGRVHPKSRTHLKAYKCRNSNQLQLGVPMRSEATYWQI